jgi:hypothetical protein
MADRDYTVGAPVSVTLHDDMTISVVVYLGEVAEAIGELDPEDTTLHHDVDVLDIGHSIVTGNIRSITYSKGA